MNRENRQERNQRQTRAARITDKQAPAELSRAQQIRASLDELARPKRGERFVDTQRLIIRYAIERFISRLSQSDFSDSFILKGAMATAVYVPNAYRTTRDADFQAHGQYTPTTLKEALTQICQIEADDGLDFSPDAMTVEEAGKDRGYPGFNVMIPTKLGASPCNLELDICFGEIVTPPAQAIDYPVLLDMEMPRIRVYPLETIISEKFQIIVNLAESNGRLKDYFDLAGIANSCVVDGATLRDAIRATFSYRKTDVPTQVPTGLTADYYEDRHWKGEWANWLRSLSLPKSTSLQEHCEIIVEMLMPVSIAAYTDAPFLMIWKDRAWIETAANTVATGIVYT